MKKVITAWVDGRLSVHSSLTPLEVYFIEYNMLQITAAGGLNCSISPHCVVVQIDGADVPCLVNADCFGSSGGCIQVSSYNGFWLELYVRDLV
jgi:hypothetical protein